MTDQKTLATSVAAVAVATAAGLVLGLGALSAQTPAQTPGGTQVPAAPAAPAPARPFPEGSKFAFLNLQRVAAQSKEGQSANAKVQELSTQKLGAIEVKNKELQANQQKLQQNQSVLSVEARLALQKDIDRINVEIQRMTQDAEAEMADLQQTLQLEFEKRLVPEIDKLAAEKQLHFIFNTESGLIWADPALDLTDEIIRRLDGTP